MKSFDGSNLRLARLFHGFSLDYVAEQTGKTRQYIHKLEMGSTEPTDELNEALAKSLGVLPSFFIPKSIPLIGEEKVHFRKLSSTKVSTKLAALAKAEVFRRLVDFLDSELTLPPVAFPSIRVASTEDIERAAERCRTEWGLGFGPIANMTRLAERMGAFVTSFDSISTEIDALSIPLKRPIIVRSLAKESPCRLRFDIAHEVGHLVMHEGVVTGDRVTESEANRFASALLLPRISMASLFPRPKSGRIDWAGISEFKQTWKVSKAAILYRAKQLGLLTEEQYKTGVIRLKRKGEATKEEGDDLILVEQPQLIHKAIAALNEKLGVSISDLAFVLGVTPEILAEFVGDSAFQTPKINNVISLTAVRSSRDKM
ncbi:XRE family transcriptional regulator [Deefgea tanakiae]|uniref:XRE family transcriptional regulator n=1 Tax=Deefgea tanakiae TaxID=2865840 RepID=A0ABX8ZAL7_9NEIS|nr:XRE family transcriptional regulator [Deefgea tanakiae]QZA78210.1 XRE family transcriptional regulator [Deefgea tanakiae]